MVYFEKQTGSFELIFKIINFRATQISFRRHSQEDLSTQVIISRKGTVEYSSAQENNKTNDGNLRNKRFTQICYPSTQPS